MISLIFILAFLGTLIIFIIILIRIFRRKPVRLLLRTMLIIVSVYSICWTASYFLRKDNVVPLGTSICFDDWCATVTDYEFADQSMKTSVADSNRKYIILHVKMINQAKRIAQKPSEPRISIVDNEGNSYKLSAEGQEMLEKLNGKQLPLDAKLELNQSLETEIVFDCPAERQNLKVIIEEGPFITKLILYSDRDVFLLK